MRVTSRPNKTFLIMILQNHSYIVETTKLFFWIWQLLSCLNLQEGKDYISKTQKVWETACLAEIQKKSDLWRAISSSFITERFKRMGHHLFCENHKITFPRKHKSQKTMVVRRRPLTKAIHIPAATCNKLRFPSQE